MTTDLRPTTGLDTARVVNADPAAEIAEIREALHARRKRAQTELVRAERAAEQAAAAAEMWRCTVTGFSCAIDALAPDVEEATCRG